MICERWAQLLGAALVVTLVRGLALFLAACAVTALVRRLSSEARHLIWLGVIAAFLLIPLAWLALPAVHVGARIPLAPAAPYRLLAAPLLSAGEYAQVIERAGMRLVTAVYSPPKPAGAAHLALLGVWLAGVLVLAARPVLGGAGLRRLAAAARCDARRLRLVQKLAGRFSIRRRITVLLSPRCSVPFTFGVLRPVILLPVGAAQWPAQRLQVALTHELAHVRRRDVLTQSAAYAVCLLFWFLPPVWLAYAALLREAETCCDQQVIDRGVCGPEYAREIVNLVHEGGGRILLPAISSALGSRGMLRQRIRNVLRLVPGNRSFGLQGALRVLAVCAACVAPILALGGQIRPEVVGVEDPLFGTWVNEEYDRAGRFSIAKTVILPSGREQQYQHIRDSEPCWECQLRIEETWVDQEGNHWYKKRWVGWVYPSGAGRAEGYCLSRVSRGGTILEGVSTQYGYPTELSALGSQYVIMHKRE